MVKSPLIHFTLQSVRIFLRASAPVLLLCAVPVYAQEQWPARSGVLIGVPTDAQPSAEVGSGIQPTASPISSTIAPKNDRLIFILPNYLTVENRQQFEPPTTRTKFRLSAKTMSDPVTISFIGMIALVGQARNSDPVVWAWLQRIRKALRHVLRRHGNRHIDDDLDLPDTLASRPPLFSTRPR